MNKKNVLIVSYSQTGQLTAIINNFISPLLNEDNIKIHHKVIKPKKAFPFPWDVITFMDTFPESIYLDGCEIEEIEDDDINYDLVIISYQVWFLSPSVPITGFLKSDWAKKKLKDKPIITLIGCRNMWIMAQEKMKKLIHNIGGKLIDNVVLIDKGTSLETFITTPRWLLTGKKNAFFGLEEAGVCKKDILSANRFGKALVKSLQNDEEKEFKSLLHGLKALEVDTKLIRSEKIATKSFTIWGGLIRKLGKPGSNARKPVVLLYLLFLLLIIVTVVPINMLVQSVLRVINKKAVLKEKSFYEQPTGCGKERLKDYL